MKLAEIRSPAAIRLAMIVIAGQPNAHLWYVYPFEPGASRPLEDNMIYADDELGRYRRHVVVYGERPPDDPRGEWVAGVGQWLLVQRDTAGFGIIISEIVERPIRLIKAECKSCRGFVDLAKEEHPEPWNGVLCDACQRKEHGVD